MPVRVERSSADVRDGYPGAVRQLLVQGGTKRLDSSVTVHVEHT